MESFWLNIKKFKKSEFEDDKGENWIDHDLVAKLDTARFYADTPFVISSACRNPSQNARVGGVKNSSHLTGLAVDIKAITSRQKFQIITGAIKAGFTRIGVSKTFIHLDIDTSKTKDLLWTYSK
jgi:uncharacterized protein YcbK (DUF882 family)